MLVLASEVPARFQLLTEQITAHPDDVVLGNQLRDLCRQNKTFDQCISFFDGLVGRYPREINLRYNAALAYIDNVPGHSILVQAQLSTRSIEHVTEVLEAQPNDWLALYIRGVNNIYWPSWYRRNGRAIADLERCVQLAEKATANDRRLHHALAYIALGDALIKANQEPDAKNLWRKGLVYKTYTDQLQTRLDKSGDELRDFIDAVRSRDVPIDTDITFMQSRIAASTSPMNELVLIARQLYGPGPFPDQQLGIGHVKSMHFTGFMQAEVPAFNNGPAEPNVSGEMRQGTLVDGRLSDGTLINENIDMGNAVIMNGQFNLLLGAVYGGPHKGNSGFSLDENYNWTINDDIAIDAGIPEAVVKINNFTFSTGPRIVPISIQTERKYPGGTDQIGSVSAGDVLVGRVGDDDIDGYVDGLFIAMGRFPLSSVLLPGAPFVQSIEFRSDIPIRAIDAALLSIANARNCLHKYVELTHTGQRRPSIEKLPDISLARIKMAVKHLERAAVKLECGVGCERIESMLATARRLSKGAGGDPAERLPQLDKLFTELRELHVSGAEMAAAS